MDEDCSSDKKEEKKQGSIMEKGRQNGAKIETGGGKMGSENVGKKNKKTTTTSGKGDGGGAERRQTQSYTADVEDLFFFRPLCVNKSPGENMEQIGV